MDRRPPPRDDDRPVDQRPHEQERAFDDAVRDVAQPFVDRAPDREAGFDRPRPSGPRDYPGRQPAGRPGPGYGPRDRGYGPPPRRPLPPSLEGIALAEGEELVAGRRPVEEAFVARREARRLLVVPQRRMALEKLVLHATSLRIPVVEVEGGTLTAIAGFDGHQGIALVVAPRRWAAPDDVLALASQRGEAPLVLVLDSLEDPQNVGTLLRTAEATGVHGAIFPTRHQAPLTPAAVKASAGAVEHLQLAPVDDLAGRARRPPRRGLRIVGADGDAPLTAREADLRGPVAIVVGSEGKGLGPAVRKRCDLLVRIPMHGRIDSLNAAVAGSILLYEAAAQRRHHRSVPRRRPRTYPTPCPTSEPAEAPARGGTARGSARHRGRGAALRTNRPRTRQPPRRRPTRPPTKPRARRVTMVTSVPAAGAATPSRPRRPRATAAEGAGTEADEVASAGHRHGQGEGRRPRRRRPSPAAKAKAAREAEGGSQGQGGHEGEAGLEARQSAAPRHAEPADADDLLPGGPPVD